MRIAIYHNLPSGGGKRALYEMTKRLTKKHDIDVYSLATGEHDFCDLRPHCARHIVHPFRTLPLARRPFGRLNQGIRGADLLRLEMLQRHVAAKIDQAGYDVVFAHNCKLGQSPGLLKYLRSPSAYYCGEPPRQIYEPAPTRPYNRPSPAQRLANSVDPFPLMYRTLLRRLDRANVRAATTVMVNSHYSRETVFRIYGIFAHVCYLGVDVDRFQPLTVPTDYRVVSVGALTPKKGFDLVVKALAHIEPAQRPMLTIISNYAESSERQYLEALAQSLGVTVTIRIGVSDEELVKTYNQSLLTVYAPLMEPFGLVVLESMACGIPVVGVCEAGVRETVLDGQTGVLVERDQKAFAAAIMNLLSDDERRALYGRRAREVAQERWTWDVSVANLERHLENSIGAKQ